MLHRTKKVPVSLDTWLAPTDHGIAIVRDLATGLVDEGRKRGVRDGHTIIVDVDVTAFLYRLAPDAGSWINDTWHVTHPDSAFDRFEHDLLPKAVRLVRDGGLDLDAHVSTDSYAANTVRSERLGKVFEIVTTGHRMLVHLVISDDEH